MLLPRFLVPRHLSTASPTFLNMETLVLWGLLDQIRAHVLLILGSSPAWVDTEPAATRDRAARRLGIGEDLLPRVGGARRHL